MCVCVCMGVGVYVKGEGCVSVGAWVGGWVGVGVCRIEAERRHFHRRPD